MRFRLLGPVEACGRTGWREISAPKERTLLAALLINPGRMVSTEQLINEIWGSSPPESARKLVSGYVIRLRKIIEDPDGCVLITRPPGYQMLVSNEDIDVGHFESLLGKGRDSLADDPAKAVELLTEALSHWRGPVLADVRQGALASAEVSRLEELQLVALELRAQSLLLSGTPLDVLPELHRLTAANPLRERFWCQLMEALAASGRAAEALDAYSRVRKIFAEELGLDPSPNLQRVHQYILMQGGISREHIWVPSTAIGSSNDSMIANGSYQESRGSSLRPLRLYPASASLVPRQLPRGVRNFVGRVAEQQRLSIYLREATEVSAPAIMVISGLEGIGKTALAVHWARRNLASFPDGQLFMDLRGFDDLSGPVLPSDALFSLLESLDVSSERMPESVNARLGLYRSLTWGKRMLILLDNAVSTHQVEQLIPGEPNCSVLITSRRHLNEVFTSSDVLSVHLDSLAEDESARAIGVSAGFSVHGERPGGCDRSSEDCGISLSPNAE
jgi:DNA-binding SARP family transcriptional activator